MESNNLLTLWFFRRIETNYLFCSDGTLYSLPRPGVSQTHTVTPDIYSRQKYKRFSIWINGKRKFHSMTGLLIKYFPLSKINKVIAQNDPYCPF